jgi:hypothetical protein
MIFDLRLITAVAISGLSSISPPPKIVHHYIFFGQDRDRIRSDSLFLNTPAIEGAQIAYTWRRLEPREGQYDFSAIREDLAFLGARNKKLFVQLQDVSFLPTRVPVPDYLLNGPRYHGGAAKQYHIDGDDEEHAVHEGWMARRWDPAVQERLGALFTALGKEFDGRIEGINLAETSAVFGESGRLFPAGYSFDAYRDGIITNMRALKRAFPKSVAMQYGNFMPGEWRPTEDKGYLRSVYDAARQLKVGMGGPDLLPFRPGQLKGPYPLLGDIAGAVPTGIAVQDGNYADVDRKTGRRASVQELATFARDTLNVDYIFWCTEEPYYTTEVVPYLASIR